MARYNSGETNLNQMINTKGGHEEKESVHETGSEYVIIIGEMCILCLIFNTLLVA